MTQDYEVISKSDDRGLSEFLAKQDQLLLPLWWAASTMPATEKHFRRITGYRDLRTLKAYLDDPRTAATVAAQAKVA